MAVLAPPTLFQAPEWLAAEMPPGYQTRLLEIDRLRAELRSMDEIGRVLWDSGDPLRTAVAAVFASLKCEVEAAHGAASPVHVKFGDARRLVLLVSDAVPPVPKTHEDLARAFQAVQFAASDDRVVFVGGNLPDVPPAARPDVVAPEALAVLLRMGVNVLSTATAFRLWRLAMEDAAKARKAVERLHAQDGGAFALQAR